MLVYVRRNNQQFGPYTDEKVARDLRDTTLLPSDLGCREGMTEWQPLGTLFPDDVPSLLKFEYLLHDRKFNDGSAVFHIYRAKIPGGWLVLMQNRDYEMTGVGGYGWGYGGATFVPDPNHEWDGSSPN